MTTSIPADLPHDPRTGQATPEQMAWALAPMPLEEALAIIARVAEQTGGYTRRLTETERLVRAQAAAPKDGAA